MISFFLPTADASCICLSFPSNLGIGARVTCAECTAVAFYTQMLCSLDFSRVLNLPVILPGGN